MLQRGHPAGLPDAFRTPPRGSAQGAKGFFAGARRMVSRGGKSAFRSIYLQGSTARVGTHPETMRTLEAPLVIEGRSEAANMKRRRSMVMGLACGALCAACVAAYVMQVDEQASAVRAEALARYGGEQIEVCVAKRDIAAGETVADSAVETKMWVAALLPEGAVTVRDDAVGKTAGTSILKGEVILSRRFDAQTNPIEVPQGFTAVSVPAREVQAIGGALTPGMKADVYAIGASSSERILTQATVLATSVSEAGTGASSASITWVTLAVAPQKVQEVIAAAENLELYFVLPAEAQGSDAKGADVGEAVQAGRADASNEEQAVSLEKGTAAEEKKEGNTSWKK